MKTQTRVGNPGTACGSTEAISREALLERRTAIRYPVNSDTQCPYVLPVVQDFGPARIKDISTDGIGLLSQHAIEPGTLIAIGLQNKARNLCRTVLVQVVHSTQVMGGTYQIGGTFLTPLTYEELRTFVM